MSAALHPPAPIHALPPPVAPVRPTNYLRYLLGSATLVTAALGAWWLWSRPATPQSTVNVEKTAVATTGPLESSIRLNGQTSARTYYTVTAPIMRGPESGGNM